MPSKKVFVVFGATGQQGGAVAKAVAQDQELRQGYQVRAVVRDPTKPAVDQLKQAGCEIVQADLDDRSSLRQAMAGASAAFLVTASVFDDHLYEREYAQGKAVADVAVEIGLDYLIFSTLPSVRIPTADRYTKVWDFDVKYDIEQYIRSPPIRSSFVAIGAFMQNLKGPLKPQPQDDGTFAFSTSLPPHTRLPYIDATDAATFVRAILREPEALQRKVICAASRMYSLEQLAEEISRVSGRTVNYKQASVESFRSIFAQNPAIADDWIDMAGYYENYGYFGPETDVLIRPSVRGEFGALTALPDFVKGLEF